MDKKLTYALIIGVLILGIGFYWYEYRPSQIKKECFSFANESVKKIHKDGTAEVKEWNSAYNFIYDNCLRKEGL